MTNSTRINKIRPINQNPMRKHRTKTYLRDLQLSISKPDRVYRERERGGTHSEHDASNGADDSDETRVINRKILRRNQRSYKRPRSRRLPWVVRSRRWRIVVRWHLRSHSPLSRDGNFRTPKGDAAMGLISTRPMQGKILFLLPFVLSPHNF